MSPRIFKGRKLLIASIGVAAVTYACNKEQERPQPVGNLMAPAPFDAGTPTMQAKDAGSGATLDIGMTSGNLVAPPPMPPPDAGNAKPDGGRQK